MQGTSFADTVAKGGAGGARNLRAEPACRRVGRAAHHNLPGGRVDNAGSVQDNGARRAPGFGMFGFPVAPGGANGGGVYSRGAVSFVDSVARSNVAAGASADSGGPASGGALTVWDTTLTLSGSYLAGNAATGGNAFGASAASRAASWAAAGSGQHDRHHERTTLAATARAGGFGSDFRLRLRRGFYCLVPANSRTSRVRQTTRPTAAGRPLFPGARSARARTVACNVRPRSGGIFASASVTLTATSWQPRYRTSGPHRRGTTSVPAIRAARRAALQPDVGTIENSAGAFVLPLLPGSPARDAANHPGCPAVDERMVPRPLDGNGDAIAVCDIGSYEAGAGVSQRDLIFEDSFDS